LFLKCPEDCDGYATSIHSHQARSVDACFRGHDVQGKLPAMKMVTDRGTLRQITIYRVAHFPFFTGWRCASQGSTMRTFFVFFR
jgi:hypothetical protein